MFSSTVLSVLSCTFEYRFHPIFLLGVVAARSDLEVVASVVELVLLVERMTMRKKI